MNSTRSITTVFSILVLLASASWFFLTHAPSIALTRSNDTPEHRFTKLKIQQFDKMGQRSYFLSSTSTYHMPNDNSDHLNTPYISITNTDQPTWRISSKQAVITEKGNTIQFLNDVTIRHEAYKDQAAGIIKTEAISYFPKKKAAHTPLEITWDQNENHIEATGMNADLITHHIELLENIRGTYRPHHD